jgi:glycosyltransferase involved in cell wall biosynthesis
MDRVLGVSKLTLERFGRWAGVSAARFRLLPNCVDMAALTPGPKPEALARELGLTGRRVIMTLGRLASQERYKGFDEVISLLPKLAAEMPDIAYLICGDGPDRTRLEAKAADLGVRERVKFSGFVPENRKPDYYRLADAYVMPSRGEGFGIVFLEALACGLPVVGSTIDGSREALLDGSLGLLVDPRKPQEVEAGILQALARKAEVPAQLATFSVQAFSDRVRAITREAIADAQLFGRSRSANAVTSNDHGR